MNYYNETPTVGSLFAGIGGFDLGFQRVGFAVRWCVEKDEKCRELLSKQFPSAAKFDDVCMVGAKSLESVDVITGGFPCQDLSVAGKRAGLGGSRSGLFYEMARIIDEIKPAFVVWENVAGLSSSNGGRDMRRVLDTLADCNYFGACRLFDAQYFGVAQRRRRWFGVFARGHSGAGRAAEILSLRKGMQWYPSPSRAAGKGIASGLAPSLRASGVGTERIGDTRGQDCVIPVLAHAVTCHQAKGGDPTTDNYVAMVVHGTQDPCVSDVAFAMGRNSGQENAVAHTLRAAGFDASEDGTGRGTPLVPHGLGVRRLLPVECERLQGFPDDWTEGFSDSKRYMMLGNAVAVPCAEWIAKRIMKVMQS